MSTPFGSFPFDAAGVDNFAHPQMLGPNKRAPTTRDVFPAGTQWLDESDAANPIIWETPGRGIWNQGGVAPATTTAYGTVIINDSTTMAGATDDNVPTSLAIKTYVDAVASFGAPIADEVTQGIGYVASDAEAIARQANTAGVEAFFLTPANLNPIFASIGAPIGSVVPDAGTFTSLTTSGGTVSLGATSASNITLTGAIDLTLASTAGSLVVNAGEAAADAIDLNATSGGLDVDVALLASITSTRNNAQAILLESTAGGIDILASGSGGSGEDIDIICTGGSVNISGTENAADAVTISAANGGIDITCGGAATEDIDLVNTAGSIHLDAGEAVSDAVNIDSAGGFDLDAVGEVNLTSTQAAATAISLVTSDAAGGLTMTLGTGGLLPTTTGPITLTSTYDNAGNTYIHANGGVSETIKIHADQGTAVTSLDLLSDVGGITLRAGLATADAINITATNAGGGIDIDAGTAGVVVDTTGAISLDAAANSNLTTTGAFSMTVNSTAGQLALTSGQAAVDAVRINASDAAGGIDVDCGTGGITIDSTGAFSIDGAAASNVTTTGAGIDLTLSSVLGSVLVESTEDAALAIRLHANGGTSETIQIHSDQGTGVASVGLLSDDGGITLRATGLASADAINLEAAAGGIDVDAALQINIASSQNAVDAIRIISSAGGIDIDAVGAATEDINITNTGGSVVVAATEAIADAITLSASAGGIDILAPGAGAGLDIDIVNTGGSVNITATEAAANAIVLSASDAAGGIDITTGGGSVDISSAGFLTAVANTANVASPTAASTQNVNVGAATFTGFTTGAAASQVFTITNSIVTTSSVLLVTVCNEGANDAQMTVQRVKRSAGAFEVTCTNNGAAALNGNVTVSWWLLQA